MPINMSSKYNRVGKYVSYLLMDSISISGMTIEKKL